MSKKTKWTAEEDSILLAQVKACPQNLKSSFKAAAQLLDRTEDACSNRWYTRVSMIEKSENLAFMCLSAKTKGYNRKNCKKQMNPIESKGWSKIWKSIITFFTK